MAAAESFPGLNLSRKFIEYLRLFVGVGIFNNYFIVEAKVRWGWIFRFGHEKK